jgi:hypothetical protein
MLGQTITVTLGASAVDGVAPESMARAIREGEGFQTLVRDTAHPFTRSLALRQQVRVLDRQIKRARWQPEDRVILSALRERLESEEPELSRLSGSR